MLRVVSHKSAAAARQYYTDGLKREDYYTEGQEVVGRWYGKAAEELGLKGQVTAEAFARLVDNLHPLTGEKLTARTNKRDRVVGYDLNFHAPKSLSLLQALTGDKEIVRVFREAVEETMTGLEAQAATRVRKGGQQQNRVTGNLAWAEFVHFTSRPVDGAPDPHLHLHCFAFNATRDVVEKRWKAANFRDIKTDASYAEATFHAKLSAKIAELGYSIERTRQGWEVAGISRDLIEKFSRRTTEIEELAQKRGVTDPKAKDALGASTRKGKRRGLDDATLRGEWLGRMSAEERAALILVLNRSRPERGEPVVSAAQALDAACLKAFANHSAVPTRKLIAHALRFGVGQISEGQAWAEFRRRGYIERRVNGEEICTSIDVLAEEVALINFVRSGRAMHPPLRRNPVIREGTGLTNEQKAAVHHLLTSGDQVMAIRGAAGAGKTTLMKDTVAQIEATGVRVFAFAPSATASRKNLRDAGFGGAQTVAHLLANPELQMSIRKNVIWIDEAGLLGIRDLWRIMKLAGGDTRVILTGDTAQHSPVSRGDAFRLLQKFAGMKVMEVTENFRQSRKTYRDAVTALSRGDLRTGFRRLEEIGAIVENDNEQERYRTLASDFRNLSRSGSIPLVVTPMHKEAAKVTAAIREAKRAGGELGSERKFLRFHDLKWDEAERQHAKNYRRGLVVQFHQNVAGFRRGAIFHTDRVDSDGIVTVLDEAGREHQLPLKSAAKFQVYEQGEIAIAIGDRIRITRGGKSKDGRRLDNGNVFTVKEFSRTGGIVLNNGGELYAHQGHLDYGYCQTSHSSQGRTVKDVLIAIGSDSFRASSKEGFYVSVSRGKESIRIYTDDRHGLQEAVGNTSARPSGVELAKWRRGEVAPKMNKGDNARWHDLLRSRHAEKAAQLHVQTVLEKRRGDASTPSAKGRFRKFIESRRGGKAAAVPKQAAPVADEKHKDPAPRKPRFLDRVKNAQPTDKPELVKAEDGAAKSKERLGNKQPEQVAGKADSRLSRLAGRYQAAIDRFKESRGGQEEKPSKPGRKRGSTPDHSARHREVGRKQAESQSAAPKKEVPVKPQVQIRSK